MGSNTFQENENQQTGVNRPTDTLSLSVASSRSINFVNWQAEKLLQMKTGNRRQNSFSFLRKVDILNKGAEDVNEAKLCVSFTPDCIQCDDIPISCLEKQKTTAVVSFNITIDPRYLYEISEAVAGSMAFVLKDKDGQILAHETQNIAILPIEESASEGRVNEILASFVTPNDDLVKELTGEAAKILEKKYNRSAFAGYQFGDKNKVVEEIDAIYLAVQSRAIHYSNPPASFEKTFQRIRLPRTVLSEKTGTCIDFSLLFASLLENVGLHPLVVMIAGHAFNGCWLTDESFPNGLEDSSTLLLNYASTGTNRIFLFDSVDSAAGMPVNFAQSGEDGFHQLQEASLFLYALDIGRCREESILPIPTPHRIDGQTVISYNLAVADEYANPKIFNDNQGVIENGSKDSKTKFDLWEEKLLDLNLRNALINLRTGGSTCQIPCSDAPGLFEKLKGQSTFTLLPRNSEPVRDRYFFAFESRKTDSADLEKALNANQFFVQSGNGAPEENLISLSRKANTEMEESGCNPLFFTVGAIRWFDNDKAAEAGQMSMVSPILLIPASIPRRRNGAYYQIELDFDGVQFNTTAFEYFKQILKMDFSEFDGLFSTKENKIDLQTIYNTIRSKIYSRKGWAILDNFVSLSTFSFAHFVMWSDLKKYREVFLSNPVVASLVDGRKEWEDHADLVQPNQIDEKISPQDLAVPLSVDSSQIEAILAAEKGESFVLDGPPGTGKSQTIANIIADFMFHKKTILFVAEKEVALNVVRKRLNQIGLGDFCLQISSAKANKKDVLAQLQQSIDISRTLNPTDYASKAQALKERRDNLNASLKALHKPNRYFVSIYDAIVAYLQVEAYGKRSDFDEAYAASLNQGLYLDAVSKLDDLAYYGKAVGSYYRNPFIPFQSRNYDISKRDALLLDLKTFCVSLGAYSDSVMALSKTRLPNLSITNENLNRLEKTFLFLRNDSNLNYPYLSNDEFERKGQEIFAYLADAKNCASLKMQLSLSLSLDALTLDAEAMSVSYKKSMDSGLIRRLRGLLALKKQFKPYAKNKKAIHFKHLRSLIDGLLQIKKYQSTLASADPFIRYVYKEEERKSPEAIEKDEIAAKNTIVIHNQLSLDPKNASSMQELWDFFVSFGNNPSLLFDNDISRFLTAKQTLQSQNDDLKAKYAFDIFADEDEDGYLAAHVLSLHKAIDSSGSLGEWANFLNVLDAASKAVPLSFSRDYRLGKIGENELVPCYKAALFYRIIASGLSEEKLTSLSAMATDREIGCYKEQIEEFDRLTIQEIAARVTANFPAQGASYASSTKTYQLNHLCANGGRGKPLRSIFDDFSELIHGYCPCFLMSPLAVSQYLEPGKYLFDMVVFDEASQIRTSEAIGPVARGRSVIVAGDQEQMPPTNFFVASLNSGDDDSDNDAIAYDDLESFLDDCLALHLPRIRLNCHYRSNHESLIAFSNSRFYENSLLTFPSPSNQVSKVRFCYVGGNYQKGKGVNAEEAKAIVNEVLRRLNDSELCKKSIGIVTFNQKQETLIEDLLDKLVYSNTKLNPNPGGETIIVRNLENVQGDERDVILFSICFGPDPKTKIMVLNFGPLSRERGERRLNVAVSRAREEMMVFASFQPEEIRAEQATNEGAEYLRSFLRYAKYGVSALSNFANKTPYQSKGSFSSFLAEDLRKEGLVVDENIGASSFRIDLAIKDPNDPSTYLLGIICDTPRYADSPTCRDRNVIQPSMLSRLHWRILHVWSVEYFDHRDQIMKKIIEAMKEPRSDCEALSETKGSPSELPAVFEKKELTDQEKYPHKIPYVFAEFSEDQTDDYVAAIVEKEWPIDRSVIDRRFRDATGYKRLGSRLEGFIEDSLKPFFKESYGGETFYWPSRQAAQSYASYRVKSDRSGTEIPFQEYEAAAADILSLQGEMDLDDLLKQVSRLFGFVSLKEKTRVYLAACLFRATKQESSILQKTAEGRYFVRKI